MQWQQDKAGQYVASFGAYEAIIQPTVGDVWKARITHEGNELVSDAFPSLSDAQAWCATQLAAVRATDA